MVRDHVASSAVLAVPVFLLDAPKGLQPVTVRRVPGSHIADQLGDYRVSRNVCEPDVEQLLDIGLNEGGGFHRGQYLGSVHGFAIVRDAAGFAREVGSQFRFTRSDHGPAVDEDLSADLLGDDLAIRGNRPGFGRRSAVFQAKKGCVFGGGPQPAPPEDGALLDQVVEPGLANLLCRDIPGDPVVFQRSHEGEGAGNIVIRLDEGLAQTTVDVVVDLTEFVHDSTVRPTLERSAQVHANDFTQDAGVDAFFVVIGDWHWETSQTMENG